MRPPRETITLESAGGVLLEARWDGPETPEQVVVFCHPHPRHRGTMTAPLMVKVTEYLAERGIAVLRFNFRGVGRSTGEWTGGEGEVADIGAAVDHAGDRHTGAAFAMAGWSFGAAAGLVYQARAGAAVPFVAIAPPVRSDLSPGLPARLPPAPRAVIIGDRDQFTTVADLEAYGEAIGARLHVLKGSDHFFYFREDRVAGIVFDELVDAR